MRKKMMLAMVAAVSVSSPAFALDLNDVLGTVDLGNGAGLPLVGETGIPMDGLAEVGLLGSTLISSENADPLISANVLDTPTDAGQVIADVKVGGNDLIDLDDLLGTLDLGGLLGDGIGGGDGDLVGGLVETVGGLTGGLTGGGDNGGGSGDLVGGVVDTVGGLTGGLLGGGDNGGGSGDLVGGVVDTVGGLTGGLLGGGDNGGGSGDLVGGVVDTVGGLTGGLTGGLLN
ncbi:hypothetical protein [Roseinatronobacter sp. S2]|uniref:hypothetical protein n=1 Tax=Roseinatronobacter sp. S2 TaxID=3035471 RepID=UPI00240F07AA|nr:hypothetical protein [Roseinatronobacter sp. S2]WFE76883.1 hypothetical protein P8S53_17720 [Roseinatronobacter sp. S2]